MSGKFALLTGFEPYGGRGVNPAFEIMRRLDGMKIGDTKVAGRPLPVSYEALSGKIDELLEELEPALVVSVGLWPGEPMIRLERVAINVADFEIPDNDGLVVSDIAIKGNAQTAFTTTLPLRKIETALLSAGIPNRVSNTAGTFLCNATMFGFLQALAARGRAVPCGFVHVPYLPSQVADLLRRTKQERRLEREQRADIASMSLETMVEAVKTVLEISLRPRMSDAILVLEGLCKRFDATVTADRLSLSIRKGEFFTFLGPSGSGKSTILRIIAGLDRPDAGKVLIAGRDMAGVPPWDRNLGMVFQQYALFPHMTVAENVGYGLRLRKLPAAEIAGHVDQMLQLVGLDGMQDKNATLLSGGEQQRVALARALVLQPSLLLLDEPLSALDEKIRREMQTELKHIQKKTGTTFLYVTHDQEEALTMSDRIAVLNKGACAQCDEPEALFRRPRTRFVAKFFRGCNVLEADFGRSPTGAAMIRIAGVVLDAGEGAANSDDCRPGVAIRAENLRLGSAAQECDLRIPAVFDEVIYRGTNVDHLLRLVDGQRLTATSTRRELTQPGSSVEIGVNRGDVILLQD